MDKLKKIWTYAFVFSLGWLLGIATLPLPSTDITAFIILGIVGVTIVTKIIKWSWLGLRCLFTNNR